MKDLYGILIKIDETLPWIELKGTYEKQIDASKAARSVLHKIQVKVIAVPDRRRRIRNRAMMPSIRK